MASFFFPSSLGTIDKTKSSKASKSFPYQAKPDIMSYCRLKIFMRRKNTKCSKLTSPAVSKIYSQLQKNISIDCATKCLLNKNLEQQRRTNKSFTIRNGIKMQIRSHEIYTVSGFQIQCETNTLEIKRTLERSKSNHESFVRITN